MTKQDIIKEVASAHGITGALAGDIFNTINSIVKRTIQTEGEFRLDGIGTFRVKKQAPRISRNPKTGEQIRVEEKNAVRFKASSKLREAVNS